MRTCCNLPKGVILNGMDVAIFGEHAKIRRFMELQYSNGGDRRLEVIDSQIVLAEYGPMRIQIQAFEHEKPLVDLAMEGGRAAFAVLEDLARFLPVLKMKVLQIEEKPTFPEVVRNMISACKKMEAHDLTPLAAVAGAASDVVADFLIARGGTRIIVDNGGDIAIRLKGAEQARIGIKTEIDARKPGYLLVIDSQMGVGGVATSGLGGRSFTKGIASAVTVIADNASSADAAATVIANATNVEHPAITRCLPETVYPDTDIAGEWVTESVGKLPPEKISEALRKGLSEAYRLHRKAHIKGAFIAVKGSVVWTDSMNGVVRKL